MKKTERKQKKIHLQANSKGCIHVAVLDVIRAAGF